MQKQTRKGRKRFERDHSIEVQLNARDRKILLLVYRHRFINSDQILASVGGKRQSTVRRLCRLYHAGYLDRPKKQRYLEGNNPMIYALGNKGMQIVAHELDIKPAKNSWTAKNREVQEVYLNHELANTQIITTYRAACRNRGNLRLIEQEEIIDNRPFIPKGKDPLSWKISIQKKYPGLPKTWSSSVRPDDALGFEFLDDNNARSYFFLEVDMATEPQRRSNFFQTAYYKKLVKYFESWHQNLFPKNFNFKKVRKLTVTTTEQRAQNMLRMQKEIDPRKKGFKMFLFTTLDKFDLKDPELSLKKIWINGRGEKVSLIDE